MFIEINGKTPLDTGFSKHCRNILLYKMQRSNLVDITETWRESSCKCNVNIRRHCFGRSGLQENVVVSYVKNTYTYSLFQEEEDKQIRMYLSEDKR